MSGYSRSPRTIRGAIVGFDILNPVSRVVAFQYNPDEVSRSLKIQSGGGQGGAGAEALRLSGAPIETISMKVEMDATDKLETGDALTTNLGIYPQLSALEMMLYPSSASVISNLAALAVGTIEVVPQEAVFTLLVWGKKRIVPVRIDSLSITEQAHDINLNPIRAEVSLGLQVLSYDDFTASHKGRYVYMAHQVIKEAMAVAGSLNSLGSAAGIGGIL